MIVTSHYEQKLLNKLTYGKLNELPVKMNRDDTRASLKCHAIF